MNVKRWLTALSSACLLTISSAPRAQTFDDNIVLRNFEIPEPSGASLITSILPIPPGIIDIGSSNELQTSQSDPFEAASVSTRFEGFGFDDNATENAGLLFIPPDPHGAAGTDRLIGVGNSIIEARSKTGTLLWRDSIKDFFFAAGRRNLGQSIQSQGHLGSIRESICGRYPGTHRYGRRNAR